MTEEELGNVYEIWDSTTEVIDMATKYLRYLWSIHIDTFGAIEAGWAIRKETN
jgi:hypothetical protein